MKPTPLKAGPQLAILVDPIPYRPGDTIIGAISRQEHIVAPRGTITIKLVGRSGVKKTETRSNGNNSTSTTYRYSKIILFEESRTIFDGPIHVAQNSLQPQTWPFSIHIPTHVSPITGNLSQKRQERSFLPLDPGVVAGTPLPATFNFHSGHSSDELDAWVEYYLEATLIEEHAQLSSFTGLPKSPKIKHARLPLLVNAPPLPPLVDFRILRHTIQNQVIQTQRLVPGRATDKLTTREHLSKFFHTSSVPKFGFSVQLEFPTVLQFGNTIPLGIRVVPTPSWTSPSILNIHQTIKLLHFKLRIIAHAKVNFDYESSKHTEDYEKDIKSHLEMDCNDPWNKMEVVIPCSWGASGGGAGNTKQLGASTTVPEARTKVEWEGESSSQAVTQGPKSKSEEAGFAIDGTGMTGKDEAMASSSQQPQLPPYPNNESSFLDLGATMKLRLGKDHMECLGKQRPFSKIVLGANFTTFNISLEHRFKWEVTLDIAGEKVKAGAEHAVALAPGWN